MEKKMKNNTNKTIVFSKKDKIRALIITCTIMLFSVLGVTYAYFGLAVEGNEQASSMMLTLKDLKIVFSDTNVINISGIYPNTSASKTFTVQNQSSVPVYYDIKMEDVYNTFVNDELVYTLTSNDGGASRAQSILPNNDGLLKAKVPIAANATHTYTITITWIETGSYQNYNLAATFKGKIQILSPYKVTNSGSEDMKLSDRILLDNTDAPASNTRSKYVTGTYGINYLYPSDYGYNNYFIFYDQDVNLTSSGNRSLGTTFSYDNSSGTFGMTGTTGTSKTYSSSDIGKYTCPPTNAVTCYSSPEGMYKILEVTGTTVTKADKYVPKPDRSSWNGLGLYSTNQNTVDGGTTYFFRGHVLNNYVSFANDLFRIVRIAEDGTIRLIRDSNYASVKFNNTNNEANVGYMVGTSEDPFSNSTDSAVKTKVEQYYDATLASYSSYLADIEFCNDRSSVSETSTTYRYSGYTRLITNRAPIFTCPNEDRDLFTMSSSSKGNKKLTKSVGLMTADEIYYAGFTWSKLTKSYLQQGAANSWWTATPDYRTKSSNAVTIIIPYGSGYVNYSAPTTTGRYARPYISLKADTIVLGGTGTINDPYVITN